MLIPLIIINLTAIGSVYAFRLTPYLPIGYVAVLILLAGFRTNIIRHPGLHIWAASLAMLWSVSMLGAYVVGTDVHGELFAAKMVEAQGFGGTAFAFNRTSIVLSGLSPLLAKLGVPLVWQFKALYPLAYSFVPVFIFLAFRRVFNERLAILSALFLITMPMFTIEMTSHVKGLAAATFLVAMLPVYFSDLKPWRKALALIALGVGVIVSHYSTATMMVMYLLTASLLALMVKLVFRHVLKWQAVARLSGIAVILLVLMAGWFTFTDSNSLFSLYGNIGRNLLQSTGAISKMDAVELKNNLVEADGDSAGQDSVGDVSVLAAGPTTNLSDEELLRLYTARTQPPKRVTGTYLDFQEQLIRTALGIDFADASGWGKAFRIIQFLTQGSIMLGFVWLLAMWRRGRTQYVILATVGVGLLIGTLFIPFLSTVLSATRIYHLALYVLAPLFVLGVVSLPVCHSVYHWRASYGTVAALMLIYFAFTSGVVFELSGSTTVDRVDLPYSVGLSNYRLDIAAAYTPDDLKVAEWLSANWKPQPVHAGYNGAVLLHGFTPQLGIFQQPFLPTDRHYYLVTSWEARHGTMVYGRSPGLRLYHKLSDTTQARIAFRSGDAVLYEFGG